jgi:hypothetical protein
MVTGGAFFLLALKGLSVSDPALRAEFVLADMSLALALLVSGATMLSDAASDSYRDQQAKDAQNRLEDMVTELTKDLATIGKDMQETNRRIIDGLSAIQEDASNKGPLIEVTEILDDLVRKVARVEDFIRQSKEHTEVKRPSMKERKAESE